MDNFTLKETGAKVKIDNEIKWEQFEELASKVGWKIKENAHLLIKEIKLKDGFIVEQGKYTEWINGLPAKDGIVLLTRLNLMVKDVMDSVTEGDLKNELANLPTK